MSKRTFDVTLAVTALLTALLAGAYFGFLTGVMPGLHHVDDRVFVATFNSINKHIQNPVFVLTFLGAPLLSLWLAWQARGEDDVALKRWVLAGVALDVLGLLISFAFNIPLNDQLEMHLQPAVQPGRAQFQHLVAQVAPPALGERALGLDVGAVLLELLDERLDA